MKTHGCEKLAKLERSQPITKEMQTAELSYGHSQKGRTPRETCVLWTEDICFLKRIAMILDFLKLEPELRTWVLVADL